MKSQVRMKIIAGVVISALAFSASAIASRVNNTPSGGYLLCVNTKTRVVTFPGTLKCPSGTRAIELAGIESSSSADDSNSAVPLESATPVSPQMSDPRCALQNILKNGTGGLSCSSQDLAKLQSDIQVEEMRIQSLIDSASAAKNAEEVAKLLDQQKKLITVLTFVVTEIAKKVKG